MPAVGTGKILMMVRRHLPPPAPSLASASLGPGRRGRSRGDRGIGLDHTAATAEGRLFVLRTPNSYVHLNRGVSVVVWVYDD